MNKVDYSEISKAKISDTRSVVISECSRGGFTIAQKMDVKESGDKITTIFMKGAFHIDDIQGLYNLRNAVNLAIKKKQENDKELEEWDENGYQE